MQRTLAILQTKITMAEYGYEEDEITELEEPAVGDLIPPDQLTVFFDQRIGEEKKHRIYKGRLPTMSDPVAVKCFDLDADESNYTLYNNERIFQDDCCSTITSHIVAYFGHTFRDRQFYIVMEYAPLGSLEQYLPRLTSDQQKVSMMYDTTSGLFFLFDQYQIIHCDVKPSNVLLFPRTDGQVQVKLCDFAYTCKQNSGNDRNKGTPVYMAPEVLREFEKETLDQPFQVANSESSDVYSLGLVFYKVMTKVKMPPYHDIFVHEKGSLLQNFSIFVNSGKRPALPPMHNDVASLIKKCWQTDPKDRPELSEVFDDLSKIKTGLSV